MGGAEKESLGRCETEGYGVVGSGCRFVAHGWLNECEGSAVQGSLALIGEMAAKVDLVGP